MYFKFVFHYRMIPNKTKEEDRHTFGVCVNILHETWDFSRHLVQWLELLRAFGVARVVAYTLKVSCPVLYLAMSLQTYLRP